MKQHLIDIGHPNCDSANRLKAPVFITNAVMGLKKTESMSTPIKQKWLTHYRDKYLNELIRLVSPKIIVPIGRHPTFAVLSICDANFINFKSLNEIIENPPDASKTMGIKIFPVAHTGAKARIKRDLDTQNKDWQRIGDWYCLNVKSTSKTL